MTHKLHQEVESAFSQLLQASTRNQEKITQYNATITTLRQQIEKQLSEQEEQQSIDQTDENTAPDDEQKIIINNITLATERNVVIHTDCQALQQHITDIATHVKAQKTGDAFKLLEPMQAKFYLLKARVEHIDHLEKLLLAYQDQIKITQKLKRVAEALNIGNFVDEIGTPPAATEEITQGFFPRSTPPEDHPTLH
jgi:hypothetical protein